MWIDDDKDLADAAEEDGDSEGMVTVETDAPKKKPVKKPAESEDDSDSDADDDEPKDEEDAEDDRDAIRDHKRDRRRANRALRRAKQLEAERMVQSLTGLVADMAKRLNDKDLGAAADEVEKVSRAIEGAKAARERAKIAIRIATEAHDGIAMERAIDELSEADRGITQLTAYQKDAEKKLVEVKETAAKPVLPKVAPSIDADMQRKNTSVFLSRHSWFRPDSDDADSAAVKALDRQVAADGYRPDTKEYWMELEKRMTRRFPDRFDGDDDDDDEEESKPKPKPNGKERPRSSGSGSRSSGGGDDFTLSKEQADAIKAAGAWDDPTRRKRLIEAYRKQGRENRRRSA